MVVVTFCILEWSLPPHSVLFCFQTVHTYPLEVLRRRMQVHSMDSRQRAASLWTLAILAKTTAFRELFAGHMFESNASCCQQCASSGHNTWQVEKAINTTVIILCLFFLLATCCNSTGTLVWSDICLMYLLVCSAV